MTLTDDVVETVARAIEEAVHPDILKQGRLSHAARAALEAARYGELVEGLNAIIDRGPERNLKWAGMTAKDIAIFALSSIGTQP